MSDHRDRQHSCRSDPADAGDNAASGHIERLDDQIRNSLIMMVDDEPIVTEMLQAHLEEQGYRNFIQLDRSEMAVELVQQQRPDVLLLDLKMPGVNGFDILRTLRANPATQYLAILVLTSSSDSETKLQALQLGATDFLAKPIDCSELALRLRNTLTVKAYQDRLTHYDTLTELPNRKLLQERATRALALAENRCCAIMNIALDRVQQINDTLGPAAGDQLLKQAARRLSACLDASEHRPTIGSGCLSRLGGDEFSVLLPGIGDGSMVEHIARECLEALQRGFNIDGEELVVSASIGSAHYPADAPDVDSLMQRAGAATAYAKEQGKDNYQRYNAAIQRRASERLSLGAALRSALQRNELQLHYQPKIDAKDGRIVGTEALLRWVRPQHGMVPPDRFIPLAEEMGLIGPIGAWVIHQACQQAAAWHRSGLGPFAVSVNVSGHQFHDTDLHSIIQQALAESRLDPRYLMLEITESMLTGNIERNIDIMHQIKATGAKLSIDDFGTGYSSLSYLKRFPIDELKIDRSFIVDIKFSREDKAIVEAIVAMARSLQLSVVAEGVENMEQLIALRNTGCNIAQGYYFSKPVSAAAFEQFCERTHVTKAEALATAG